MLKLKRFLNKFNIKLFKINKYKYKFNCGGKIYNIIYIPTEKSHRRYKLYYFNPIQHRFTLDFQGGVGMLLEYLRLKIG